GYRIVLVTDARGERYAAEFPCDDKRMVEAATFSGGGLAAKPAAALAILRGVAESVQLFGRIKPVAVIGFGGYPSLPAMAAAVLRRTPSAIHEQNAILGRVNRALAPFVTKIAAELINELKLKCDINKLVKLKREAEEIVKVVSKARKTNTK
ncbi:MAG: glycosyltransferase, partial [Bacteroidota bacterium]